MNIPTDFIDHCWSFHIAYSVPNAGKPMRNKSKRAHKQK